MQLSLCVDSIYEGSICRLTASSHKKFDLSTNAKIIAYEIGTPALVCTRSFEDKGKHQIGINLVDVIKERKTGYGESGSASQYGMTYFPFISSHFSIKVTNSIELSNLMFEVPANFRIIWRSATATAPSGDKASLSTSYGEKGSTYIFSWSNQQAAGTYAIDFDVRTGGPGLLKAAYFPIYYYSIALLAVAAAGTAEHANILLGAIAAAWVFFLRHLNTCDIPRRNVLLFYATFLLGVFLLIWGISWKLHRYYHNEWVIGIEIIMAAAIIIGSLKAVRYFGATGKLPSWVICLCGYFISLSDKRQNNKQES